MNQTARRQAVMIPGKRAATQWLSRISRGLTCAAFGIFALAEGLVRATQTTAVGQPVKYMASCQIDLNADRRGDIVLLMETVHGEEAIVLMRGDDQYSVHVPSRQRKGLLLSCHFGSSIRETTSGAGTGRQFTTPGAYFKLEQPEGAAVGFFWNGTGFTEVWISD